VSNLICRIYPSCSLPSCSLPSSPASLLLRAVALHAPHKALRLRLYERPPAFRSTCATLVWFWFMASLKEVRPHTHYKYLSPTPKNKNTNTQKNKYNCPPPPHPPSLPPPAHPSALTSVTPLTSALCSRSNSATALWPCCAAPWRAVDFFCGSSSSTHTDRQDRAGAACVRVHAWV
jgi:hypothetical protein